MSWYTLALLHAEDKDEDLDAMWRAAWKVTYAEQAQDSRNAVFRRSGEEPAIFFTPAARELADAFGAKRCEQPASRNVHLIAGDEGAWKIFFPDAAPRAPSASRSVPDSSGDDEPFQGTQPSMLDELFYPTSPSRLG